MKCFIIVEESTNKWLPLNEGKVRGFTHVEPTNEVPPRLFMSKTSAEKSLVWWKQGGFYQTPGGGDWKDDFHINFVEKPERKKMKMIIKPAELVI